MTTQKTTFTKVSGKAIVEELTKDGSKDTVQYQFSNGRKFLHDKNVYRWAINREE